MSRAQSMSSAAHEHDLVRLVHTVIQDGETFPAGTCGTIVSVYDDCKAYAVEINAEAREPAILTLRSDQVARVPKV